MVSVSEATSIIQSRLFNPGTITCHLNDAVGKVSAENVYADRDFPPFDRVTMDGIGVSYEKLLDGQREFTIEDIQAAGAPQKKLQNRANCIEVMTGAMSPEGVDAVIPYEDMVLTGGTAKVIAPDFRRYQNIHKRGIDVNQGDLLVKPGDFLSPAEIALLASIGKKELTIKTFPSVAIISTGDELVDIDEAPLPHQIRRSNSYALRAALMELGVPSTMHHVADDEVLIEDSLKKIFDHADVLVLSGGVSKGKFDYVPKVLERLGIGKLFHRVTQRPGKPFWFGSSEAGKAVFALPGNPVSTFMCFYKYIKPWLLKSLDINEPEFSATLAGDFSFQPDLTYFLQVKIKIESSRLVAYPKVGGGSGDFANLNDVDGFLELPAEQTEFTAGEVFPYIGFRKLM